MRKHIGVAAAFSLLPASFMENIGNLYVSGVKHEVKGKTPQDIERLAAAELKRQRKNLKRIQRG